jgi:hypothetical protein
MRARTAGSSEALPAPVELQPNTTYIVSVNANSAYPVSTNALTTQVSNGPLHTVSTG